MRLPLHRPLQLANPYDELGKHGPGRRRLLEQNHDAVPCAHVE